MSKIFTATLPVFSQSHASGITLSYLLGDLHTQWPNITAKKLSDLFADTAQHQLLNEHQVMELFRYCAEQPFHVENLQIEIPENSRRYDAQKHRIDLNCVLSEYRSGQWFGFVPSVGVANIATSKERLLERLIDTVLVEFNRSARLPKQSSLIEIQWFDKPVIHTEMVSLSLLTPAELAQQNTGKESQILPKTAHRVIPIKRKAFGFESYLEELSQNLQGEFRQSVLIVGPSGSGKTALILEYIRLNQNNTENTVWQTTAAQMIRFLTEDSSWQYGLAQWVSELRKSTDLVYMGNFSEYFEVGQYSGSSVSLADALRDTVQRNEITLIAEITEGQLEKMELRSPGYSDQFHVLRFNEATPEQENNVAKQAISAIASEFNLRLDDETITRTLALQRRYSPYSGYPGKTIRFFESLALQNSTKQSQLPLKDIIEVFCDETGMPKALVDDEISFSPKDAIQFFSDRIIGQSEAITELVYAITNVKTRMAKSKKPILSGLFVGPTGVGKTEIVKTLAEFIFGDRNRMIRVDMSEYSSYDSPARLVAATEDSLVTRVRQQPFSVVLLDEIEKANIGVFDLLLQVLDEGRLTDDSGELANFCSTIVIMTSNIGAQEFNANSLGFTESSSATQSVQHFEDAISKHLRPELINRIDLVIPFSSLSREELIELIEIEIQRLISKPAILKRVITWSIDPGVYDFLASLVITSKYGAREVKRLLQKQLVTPLSETLAMHNGDLPLEIQLKRSGNRIDINASEVREQRSHEQSLIQWSEEIAKNRRWTLGIEQGNTWTKLLSELDRLEVIRSKNEKMFWKKPQLFNQYDECSRLKEQMKGLLSGLYKEEERILEHLLDKKLTATYQTDLSVLMKKVSDDLLNFLIKLDTYTNNEFNLAMLSFFGSIDGFQTITKTYQGWLNSLGLEHHVLYWYSIQHTKSKPAGTHTEAKDSANPTTQTGNEAPYEIKPFDEIVNRPGHTLYGQSLVIKGPSVARYFYDEPGVWQIDTLVKSEYVFVELHTGLSSEYEPPTDTHRQRFFSQRKSVRTLAHGDYKDVRYQDGETIPLHKHPNQLINKRIESLKTSHIRHYQRSSAVKS